MRIDADADGVTFTVKVVPGASRSKLAGYWGDALRLAVSAPPEAGKANQAVIRLLAAILDVKRGNISIVSGASHPLKRIAARGLSRNDAQTRIERALRG